MKWLQKSVCLKLPFDPFLVFWITGLSINRKKLGSGAYLKLELLCKTCPRSFSQRGCDRSYFVVCSQVWMARIDHAAHTSQARMAFNQLKRAFHRFLSTARINDVSSTLGNKARNSRRSVSQHVLCRTAFAARCTAHILNFFSFQFLDPR